jgi:hypothetical protein
MVLNKLLHLFVVAHQLMVEHPMLLDTLLNMLVEMLVVWKEIYLVEQPVLFSEL